MRSAAVRGHPGRRRPGGVVAENGRAARRRRAGVRPAAVRPHHAQRRRPRPDDDTAGADRGERPGALDPPGLLGHLPALRVDIPDPTQATPRLGRSGRSCGARARHRRSSSEPAARSAWERPTRRSRRRTARLRSPRAGCCSWAAPRRRSSSASSCSPPAASAATPGRSSAGSSATARGRGKLRLQAAVEAAGSPGSASSPGPRSPRRASRSRPAKAGVGATAALRHSLVTPGGIGLLLAVWVGGDGAPRRCRAHRRRLGAARPRARARPGRRGCDRRCAARRLARLLDRGIAGTGLGSPARPAPRARRDRGRRAGRPPRRAAPSNGRPQHAPRAGRRQAGARVARTPGRPAGARRRLHHRGARPRGLRALLPGDADHGRGRPGRVRRASRLHGDRELRARESARRRAARPVSAPRPRRGGRPDHPHERRRARPGHPLSRRSSACPRPCCPTCDGAATTPAASPAELARDLRTGRRRPWPAQTCRRPPQRSRSPPRATAGRSSSSLPSSGPTARSG